MNYTELKIIVGEKTLGCGVDPAILISLGQKYLEDTLRLHETKHLPDTTPFLPTGKMTLPLPSDYLDMIYLHITDQLNSPSGINFSTAAGSLAGGTYSYRVSAIVSTKETNPSGEQSVTVTTSGASGTIVLNWSANGGVDGFKIYKSTDGITFNYLATVGSGVTTYEATGITSGQQYWFSVLVDNAESNSYMQMGPLLCSGIGINVNWTKVTGATGYKIYGRTSESEQLIATVGDVATYLDDGSITPSGAMPIHNSTGTIKKELIEMVSAAKYASTHTSGEPTAFEIVGNKIYFDMVADKNYAYEMMYYHRLTELSDASPENDWILNMPELLLYACLTKASPFLPAEVDGKGNLTKGLWQITFESLLSNFVSKRRNK